MNEVVEVEDLICPWCYSSIAIFNHDESFRCNVCERIITEEDLENADFKED